MTKVQNISEEDEKKFSVTVGLWHRDFDFTTWIDHSEFSAMQCWVCGDQNKKTGSKRKESHCKLLIGNFNNVDVDGMIKSMREFKDFIDKTIRHRSDFMIYVYFKSNNDLDELTLDQELIKVVSSIGAGIHIQF